MSRFTKCLLCFTAIQLSMSMNIYASSSSNSCKYEILKTQRQSTLLTQCRNNLSYGVMQIDSATCSLQNIQTNLLKMKDLAEQANSETLSAHERLMLQLKFTPLITTIDMIAETPTIERFSLLAGGPGNVTPSRHLIATPTATGLTAIPDAFQNYLNIECTQGLISGIATDACVRQNGGLYDISVVVGPQTFFSTVPAPTVGGTLTLVSKTDSANSISFLYYAGSVAAFDGTAPTFEKHLRDLLGIDTASQAVFTSVSSSAGGIPGVYIEAGNGTKAGTWALTYTGAPTGGTGAFKLTRGDEFYTTELPNTFPATTRTTAVVFDNGTMLSLAVGFNSTQNIPQETYTFTQGTQVIQTIQYGPRSSDILNLCFDGATVASLGLRGISIDTEYNARLASYSLNNALNVISNQIAYLGGKGEQLKSLDEFLAGQIGVLTQRID